MALIVASGMTALAPELRSWRRFITMQHARRECRAQRPGGTARPTVMEGAKQQPRGARTEVTAGFSHKGAGPKWNSRVRLAARVWSSAISARFHRNSAPE